MSKALLLCVAIIQILITQSDQLPTTLDFKRAVSGYNQIDGFLQSSMTNQLEKLNHVRKRRQSSFNSERLYRDGEVGILQGFQNLRGCPKASRQFKIFQNNEDHYAAIITSAAENNTEIYHFTPDQGCRKLPLAVLPTRAAFDLELIRTNEGVRLVVLEENPPKHPHKRAGSSVYTLAFEEAQKVRDIKAEVLRSERPNCITSWIQFGVPHLAMCSSITRNFNGSESYSTQSYIYCASGGYFDQCGAIDTHFPQAIQHVRIFNRHYLAVANHPNQTSGEDVPTEILRYDLSTSTYKHWQYLPTKAAKDLCFFTMGSDMQTLHLLVIVNHFPDADLKSHIYQFVGGKFEPFQALSASGATNCLFYQTDVGRSALIFTTPSGAIVYQYNGWRFVSTSVAYSQYSLGAGVRHLNQIAINQAVYLTVANDNPLLSGADNLFTLKFLPLESPLSTAYNKSLTSCHQTVANLVNNPIGLIVDLYNQAVKKNDTQIQLGRITFNRLSAQTVITNEVENKANGTRLGALQITQLQDLAKGIDRLAGQLGNLTQRVKLSIRTNGSYVIQGPIRIHSLTVLNGSCEVKETNAIKVNSVVIADVYANAIMLTDKRINSTVRFNRLTVSHRIETEFLSGRDVLNYIQVDENLKLTNITIDGDLRIVGNTSVDGLINDQNFSPSALLLRNGHQRLNWTLKVGHARFKKLKSRFVNGKEIDQLFQNAMHRSANVTLLQPIFQTELKVTHLKLTGLLNGIDVVQLDRNSMKISGNQVVTGSHVISEAHISNATLHGRLNDRDFPSDFILIRESDPPLTIKKVQLTKDAVFTSLAVSKNVSGLPVVNGRLGSNLFNKSSHELQVVTGRKTFHSITAGREVSSQTINGRPMDHFDTESSIFGNSTASIVYDHLNTRGIVKFEKPIHVSDVTGIDLERLAEKAIPLTTKEFPPRDNFIIFTNVRVIGDLTAKTLNGVPTSGFISKGTSTDFPEILGCKTFTKGLSMPRTFALQYRLNGYDLKALWNETLRLEGDQILHGSLRIATDVQIVKLEAASSPFVALRDSGPLTGKKIFHDLTIEGDWFVDTLLVNGFINEVDINSWFADTIVKSKKHQAIKAQKTIKHLRVNNALVSLVDGMDMNHLIDLVDVDQPAVIFSDVVITGHVFGQNIITNGSIDGVDSNAPLTWLRQGAAQNISGAINVNGSLRVGDYRQDSWLVNGINVSDLINRTVHTDQVGRFASLHFDHVIVDDLLVNGTVQGLNLSKDLVTKLNKTKLIVSGWKSFSGPLVSESLHVRKDFNGQDPKKLCQTLLPPQNSQWVIRGNVTVKGDAKIDASLVNNQNLTELLNSVWLKTSNVHLNASQSFGDVVINGTLVEGLISNVNLSDLYRRSVKLASATEQAVVALHRFQDLQVSDNISVENLMSTSINGINISQLTTSVLLRDVDQVIPNHILFQDVAASNIDVNGKVNDLDLSSVMMRKDGNNVITGQKSLTSLTVKGALEVCSNCLIDTVDVSRWAARVLLRQGNFSLSATEFESIVIQQPVTVNGTINGVQVNKEQLLTRSHTQVVRGPIVLSSLLPDGIDYNSPNGSIYQEATEDFKLAARFAKLQVNGLYDGVNLSHFYNQSIRRNVDVVFKEPVVLWTLIADDVKDSSINSTLRDVVDPQAGVQHVAQSLPIDKEEPIGNTSFLVERIKQVVSRQSFELKFFEEVPTSRQLPAVVDAVYAWQSPNGEVVLWFYTKAKGELFYGSSASPLLKQVEVTGVASSARDDFAVATLDRSAKQKHDSFIIVVKDGKTEKQTIPTVNPIGCVAFTLLNRSCYLFVESARKSPIYCRPLDSNGEYSFSHNLDTVDSRLVTVGYHYTTKLPLLVVASAAQRGHGRIVIWSFNATSNVFEPWKTLVTLQIVAMDCMCDDVQCLLATVAPAKPAAIPGQVIIWRLKENGQPSRVQRMALSDPVDVKFARLPDGRFSLLVLQRSGVDNVLVHVWRGFLQFQLVTTVRVPGAQDLQRLTNQSQLLLALSAALPAADASFGSVRMFRAHFLGQLHH